jgi:hypothetical protein
MTTVANLPLVSATLATPAKTFATGTVGVVDTADKFATGVNNNDGKFATGVNNTVGK